MWKKKTNFSFNYRVGMRNNWYHIILWFLVWQYCIESKTLSTNWIIFNIIFNWVIKIKWLFSSLDGAERSLSGEVLKIQWEIKTVTLSYDMKQVISKSFYFGKIICSWKGWKNAHNTQRITLLTRGTVAPFWKF